MRTGLAYSASMVRIGTKRPRRLFLSEWMEKRELTDERLAGRLGVERETVNRWRNYPQRLSLPRIEEIAEALDLDPADLWRHPGRPSADALLRDASDDVQAKAGKREEAAAILEATTQDHQKAAEHLANLQAQLNAILGQVLPAGDARVRIG